MNKDEINYYRETLDYPCRLEREGRAFYKVLRRYFPNPTQNPRILNICCGIIAEEPFLFQHFGESSEITSIDHDPRMEEFAKAFERRTFQYGLLKNLWQTTNGRFDVILGRNVPLNPTYRMSTSDLEEYHDPWPDLFETLKCHMEEGATMFLTLVRPDEFHRALELIEHKELDVVIKERNRIKVPSEVIGVNGSNTKDHYIVRAKRKF